jgi:hypothetical protein
MSLALMLSLALSVVVALAPEGVAIIWYWSALILALILGVLGAFSPTGSAAGLAIACAAGRSRTWDALRSAIAYVVGYVGTLAMYGVIFAGLGLVIESALSDHAQIFDRAALALGGMFVYALALGEIGLARADLPLSRVSVPPDLARTRRAGVSFMIGVFNGNIGLTPHLPVLPLLLFIAAVSGDPGFGLLLLASYGIGQSFLIPALGLLGGESIRLYGVLYRVRSCLLRLEARTTLLAAAFAIVIGIFGWSFMAASGLLAVLAVNPIHGIVEVLPSSVYHILHAPAGSWILFLLLVGPMWGTWARARRMLQGDIEERLSVLDRRIARIARDRHALALAFHLPGGEDLERLLGLDRRVEALEKERVAVRALTRFRHKGTVHTASFPAERAALIWRAKWYLAVTFIVALLLLSLFPSLV